MKIMALLTDAFGGYGGISLYNRNLLTVICEKMNCERVVAIPRIMPEPTGIMPKEIIYITKGVGGKIKYLVTVFQTVLQYKRFDLIICGHINLTPIACLIGFLLNIPVLLIIYGIEAWLPNKRIIVNYSVRKIDAFISISQVTKKRFNKWNGLKNIKGFILPCAIQNNKISPGPKNHLLVQRYNLKDKIVIMTLGRMLSSERAKGFDEVINILPLLIKKVPNVVYMIVGKGDDQTRLIKRTKCLKVYNRVIFTDFVPESEKPDYYRLADVFVMPSRGEGFGFVLLEAMACGVPVVASKLDGGREALRDGKLGVLIDPTKPKEIVNGILEGLQRPHGVLPNGFDYFGFDQFVRRTQKIIDQVVADNC